MELRKAFQETSANSIKAVYNSFSIYAAEICNFRANPTKLNQPTNR